MAIVVAHPDDETIAAGARLHLMPGLLLVHVTDGAPRRLNDPVKLGFPSPEAYADAREQELQAALACAGVSPARIRLGVPDQDASLEMPGIADRLRTILREHAIEAVVTHAYEGGHPDHDAVCRAVHAATDCPVYEFAGYHAGPDGEMTVARFLPGPPETRVLLDPREQARKQAMLDCFATQRDILRLFGVSVERYRRAGTIDFSRPPHEGALNYERWGWEMTGARWRSLAKALPWAA